MDNTSPRNQAGNVPTWVTGLIYVSALLAGVSLIISGKATTAEASGYVAPFLVVYERVVLRKQA